MDYEPVPFEDYYEEDQQQRRKLRLHLIEAEETIAALREKVKELEVEVARLKARDSLPQEKEKR